MSSIRRSPSPATKSSRSEEIKARKRYLRVNMIAKLKANPADITRKQSAQTTSTLLNLPQWKTARSILVFSSLPQEFQTKDLIDEAFTQHKHVFLPRVTDVEASTMEMYEIFSMDDYQCNEVSAYGISEPTFTLPPPTIKHISANSQSYITTHPYLFNGENAKGLVSDRPNLFSTPSIISTLDLILCPFVLVDSNCNRVGYGGGYYDRYLTRVQAQRKELGLPSVPIIGVGLLDQLYDFELPADDFDIKLDGAVAGDRTFGIAAIDMTVPTLVVQTVVDQ